MTTELKLQVGVVATLFFLNAFAACSDSTRIDGDGTSETNWLKRCASQDDCSEDSSCQCGICTQPCESAAACSDVPGAATCLVTESLDDGSCRVVAETESDRGICVAACVRDRDCNGDSGFECVKGICVAILNDSDAEDGSSEVDYGLVFSDVDSELTKFQDSSIEDDADISATNTDAELSGDAASEGDASVDQENGSGAIDNGMFPQCPCTVDVQEGTRAPKYEAFPDNAYGGPEFENILLWEIGINRCEGGVEYFFSESDAALALMDNAADSFQGLEALCLYFVSCEIGCSRDDDCPDVNSGSAVARCSDYQECYLQCDEQKSCPDGMMCVSGVDRSMCLWPQDAIKPGCPAFCEQEPIPRECPNFCASQLMACNPEGEPHCCEGLICAAEGYCVQ